MTIEHLREQAIRAERLAKSVLDKMAFYGLMALASEYRERAEELDRRLFELQQTKVAQTVRC
jgi:hypothetical protein